MQGTYEPVGTNYQLPMISILNAIKPEIDSGALSPSAFFASDGLHPTDYGHQVMADCISNLFQEVYNNPNTNPSVTIPDGTVYGKQYQGIRMIASNDLQGATISTGSYSGTDTALGTFMYAPSQLTFPNNWYKAATSNNLFTMSLTCSNLMIVYKQSNVEFRHGRCVGGSRYR